MPGSPVLLSVDLLDDDFDKSTVPKVYFEQLEFLTVTFGTFF
jgi:hypothetical protein